MPHTPSDFCLFAEALPDAAFVAEEGVVVWANAAWPACPVGRSLPELFDARPVAVQRTLDMTHTHPSVAVDWPIAGGDALLKWTLRRMHGRLYGLSAHQGDRVSSDRERLLLMGESLTNTGFWTIDLASGAAWWSDEIYRIHGYDPGSVPSLFQLGLDHYLPEDRARVQAIADYAIASGEPYEFEATLRRSDGELALVQCIGRPERDPVTGEVNRLIGAFRDVTTSDRTRRIQELEMFARVAAHDLRGPARNIRSFVELLIEGMELTDAQQHHHDTIVHSVGRLLAIIDGVGDFARSGVEFNLSPVPLLPLLQAAIDHVRCDVEACGGSLSLSASEVTVLGHRKALRKIVDQVLANAVHYRTEERPLEVHVHVDDTGDAVCVRVCDNGRGIEDDHHDYVFQPFRRVHTDRPGTGVGLAVSRRLVEQCRGRIKVLPCPDQPGTCIELSLLRA